MPNPIGWCDRTWNPITGCTPVSEACEHCYAERMAIRLAGRFGYPDGETDEYGQWIDYPFRVTFHADKLDAPLHWRKGSRVFVCSMGDLFHGEVPDEWRDRVFDTMTRAWQHTYLLLTKRPENMRRYVTEWTRRQVPEIKEGLVLPGHIWVGVTAENQLRADERIPILLDTPAAKRFVSCEPLLEPVGLMDCLSSNGRVWHRHGFTDSLDWVIAGPENGPGKRPMDLDWARSLRDQCAAAGVPFWYKGGLLDGREHKERGQE